MPRDSGDPSVRAPARRHREHTLPGLRMKNLQPVPAAASLIARAAQEPSVEAPADAAHSATVAARHGAPADPVGRVPEGDERVGAADSEVAAGRGESEGEACGGVGVEGVSHREGGVGEDLDGAVARRDEEVEVRGGRGRNVVGEGGCVGLDGLGVRIQGCVSGGRSSYRTCCCRRARDCCAGGAVCDDGGG